MDHKPYIRQIPGSRCAVLMVHGIAGSPAQFRDLMPVIPEDWSVYNILLDGHGGTVQEFSRSDLDYWRLQVDIRIHELLANYEKILIVAHSMGTLFAIQSAIRVAFPLRTDSDIDTMHPAFMQAAKHVASCPNLHNAGRNVTQILTNLRKCGCNTVGEFKNASIARLVTAPRLKGKVLRPIVEAVHCALQNVDLLLPETPANSPSEVKPKPAIRISADSSI